MSSTPLNPSAPRAEPRLGSARSWSLDFYARSYFHGIRINRRWLPMGKALACLGLVCFLLAWDPSRVAMRHGLAFVIAAFASAWIVNSWRQPRSLSFSRELPDRVVEGSPFDYAVVVKNGGKRASPLLNCKDHGLMRFPSAREWLKSSAPFDSELNFFDRWAGYPKWLWLVESLQDVVGADFQIPPLLSGESVRIPVKGRAGRRGRRLFVGFYCGLIDPLGLRQRLFYSEAHQTLLVLPKPLHSGIGVPLGSRSISSGDARDLLKTGDSEEFRSLREWRSGDPIKRIDWKATARSQSPVAREYAPEYKLRTALAFDTSLPDGVDEQAFEDAMGYAAGLAVSIDRKDRNIDLLMVEGHVVSLRLGQGAQDYVRALERLADSTPSGLKSLDELEASIFTAAAGFSSVVLVCPAWTERHAAMAARLAAKGIGLTILVCSDHVRGPFPGGSIVRLTHGATEASP